MSNISFEIIQHVQILVADSFFQIDDESQYDTKLREAPIFEVLKALLITKFWSARMKCRTYE